MSACPHGIDYTDPSTRGCLADHGYVRDDSFDRALAAPRAVSDPIVNAITQAIEGQDLWHGRYATPAGPATARAILAHLSDLGWVLAPTPPDALQECYKGCSICATLNEMDEAGE